MPKVKYYSLDKILKHNAEYNIIYGERSNGKTTAVLAHIIKDYLDSDSILQGAIIRRWDEDFKVSKALAMFQGIENLGWIEEWSKGRYNRVNYFSGRFYLCKYDDLGKKKYMDEQPFCYSFSLTAEEHYKSTSYPCIKNILFDEFITRSYYLPDEFVKFQNLLSTIIRLRDDVKIFMCANTINKYCPYFDEMGLTNVKNQKQGTIDLYSYGENTLKVAVEYCTSVGQSKKSNKYFAFDNPKLEMIKTGGWEISIYPHLPCKYSDKEVAYKFYIVFNGEILQGNVIFSKHMKTSFIYIHRKTTPIQEDNKNLVYVQEYHVERNYRINICRPNNTLTKKIWNYFVNNQVYYQDNPTGEVMRNYLMVCKKGLFV